MNLSFGQFSANLQFFAAWAFLCPMWRQRIFVLTFSFALADDFNTPKALASLFEWVREANRRSGESAGSGGSSSETGASGGDGASGGPGSPVGEADLREMLAVLGLGELTPLASVGDR